MAKMPSGPAALKRRYAADLGPVAQRTERQPSKLRAEVRLLPGPFPRAAGRSSSRKDAVMDEGTILLIVGARRALRPADIRHPFGHARYRYLYAFVVSLAVFWVGGVLSLLEGINHLFDEDKLIDPRWAFAVLAVSAVLEGWSLGTTVRAWRGPKGRLSWRAERAKR